MKISIVIPTYNEEKNIVNCLTSIINSNYSKENYEVLIINDGSKDKTQASCENFIKKHPDFNIKLINQENKGRMKTRLRGAKLAKHPNILFIDSRVTIFKDSIKHLSQSKDKVIIAGCKGTNVSKTIYDKFFHLMRKLVYKNRYPQKENTVKITKKNFNKEPKGTTSLFIKKDIFLKSMNDIKNMNKNASDDTKLFEAALNHTKYLIRDNDFKIDYKNRHSIKSILKHTFNRGPKFIDYYLKPNNHYFPILIILYIFTALAILSAILSPISILYILGAFMALTILTALLLSEKIKDFFICLYLIPPITIAFYLGLLKGSIIKLFHLD